MTYTITVKGEPVPKARPRVVNGHAFTPAKTKHQEAEIALEWVRKYGNVKTDKPIYVEVLFCMRKPKGKTTLHVQKRPDIDNLIKTVLDGLNDVAYNDDKQVFRITAIKRWAVNEPYTKVWIREETGE